MKHINALNPSMLTYVLHIAITVLSGFNWWHACLMSWRYFCVL